MEWAVVSSLGLGSLASVGLYKLVRPRFFNVTVNCHFCNNNFKVSGPDGNIEMIMLRCLVCCFR